MKIFEFFKTKKFRNIITWILLWTIILYTWVFTYSIVFEQDKLTIDRYNFEQLEKVKNVLDKQDKNSYTFKELTEFNQKFNQNIKPTKNCYFMSDRNRFFEDNKWGGGYVFWFQFESLISKFVYFWSYYAYPKYDLPYWKLCLVNSCTDSNRNKFTYTISNPCWDSQNSHH